VILRESQIAPRGLSKSDAAAYCGCRTEAAFDDWITKGIVPGPIPGTQRWDRKLIDRWLDKVSGITDDKSSGSALADWQASRRRA
jgi:hypothetical protein